MLSHFVERILASHQLTQHLGVLGGVPDEEDRSAVEQARRVKLARLRAAGIDAFPVGFRRSHTLEEVRRGWEEALEPGQESDDVVRVAGRIVLKRIMGRLAFWTLRHDGDELQAMLAVNALGPQQFEVVTDLAITGKPMPICSSVSGVTETVAPRSASTSSSRSVHALQ